MAILSSDKLVVVKAFAMGNPLPLDAREIWDSLAEAKAYAASNATAYAGQTIKVVESGVVTAYYLVPSDVEGENYSLVLAGGGGTGIQGVATSAVEGNIQTVAVEGDHTVTKNVPVVGALVNPVVDEDAHTLTLTKIAAKPEDNTEVVIPLGGASPEDGIVSGVEVAEDGVSLTITVFDPETETESTKNVKLAGVVGTVTDVDPSVAGVIAVSAMGEDGEVDVEKLAVKSAVINPTYDAATKVLTLPVVTGVAEDGTATTTAVTVDMKAVVAGAFVDVAHTADTEDASAKLEFTYKDAAGADQTKAVYETGVRKVEAGSTADKIKVTTADTTGALSAAEILVGAGSVKNPAYDAETRKITLPILQADGSTQNLEINLGKDMVVKSGSYNTESQEIVLVLTDGSEVKIPAASLVDIYTGGETATVAVSVSDGNVITAEVKLSTVEKNILKKDENGLYVLEADFTETKQLIVDAQAAAEQHADDIMADEVEARNEAIATAKGEAVEEANGYTDDQIADEVEARNEAIATAKGEAVQHADDIMADEVEARNQAIADAQAAAEQHADDAIAAEVEARNQAIADAKEEVGGNAEQAIADAQAAAEKHADDAVAAEVIARDAAIATAKQGAVTEANGYTDGKIAAEVEARDAAIEAAQEAAEKHADDAVAAEATSRDTAIATAVSAAKTEVNGYTDTKVAGALAEAKAYTDEKVGAETTARETAITDAKTELKSYIDEKVTAITTTWVDFGA